MFVYIRVFSRYHMYNLMDKRRARDWDTQRGIGIFSFAFRQAIKSCGPTVVAVIRDPLFDAMPPTRNHPRIVRLNTKHSSAISLLLIFFCLAARRMSSVPRPHARTNASARPACGRKIIQCGSAADTHS